MTLCPSEFFATTADSAIDSFNMSFRLTTNFSALLLGALLSMPSAASAQALAAADHPTPKPRVALVLSGGGARGLAHIGVLRALRELHVPVDIVVGTSMGSVIGGAYAAGRSVEELESIARSIPWDEVLADRPSRDRLTQRRREEDVEIPSRLEFGLSRQGLSLPPAAAGNAALEAALAALLPTGQAMRPAAHLALPFRAVAADLLTGDLVELSDAPLLTTLRASLSVPGVFAPVRVQGRLLVDGGLVRNLPVDIARAMGAEAVIAVNLGTSLAPENQLGSSLGVAQQMLNILTEQNVQRSLKELGPADILITPEMGGIGFLDFKRHETAFDLGASAVRKVADRLRRLAVTPERFAALEGSRQSGAAVAEPAVAIASVEVQGTQRINPAELLAQTGLRQGESVTPEQVRLAAARLYGRGDIALVDTVLSDSPKGRQVMLNVSEAAWAQNRVRLGLELNSDFADNSSFGIVAGHVMTSMNAWGAEWRTTARVGSSRELRTQWWQPLGAGSAWYLQAEASYASGAQDVFVDGHRLARIGQQLVETDVALGRQLGSWGDIRLGWRRASFRGEVLIPQDPSLDGRGSGSARYVAFNVDTLEPLSFPVRGQLLQAQWTQSVRLSAQSPPPLQSQVLGMYAFSVGNLGGHVYGEWARQRNGFAPRPLGGFLRLSGTEPVSVDGSTVVLTRLVLAHSIGELPFAAGRAVRAGFSLELGNGFAPDSPVHLGGLRQAGSVFVSADTRFGPLYLAAGATRGTAGTFYLFLGPIW